MQARKPALMALSFLMIFLFVVAEIQTVKVWSEMNGQDQAYADVIEDFIEADGEPPRAAFSLANLVSELMAVTIDTTDSDGDTIVDSIEAVIGTDAMNNDSDFDRVLDQFEIWNGTDPLEPDSNFDGLPDYYELQAANQDPDGDGIDNAWDFDNDNDGVGDEADLSPFCYSEVEDSFHMEIATDGNPTYITLQLRPRNPDHLKLFYQYWDWPYDTEGSMKDMDYSTEDVRALPQLNVIASPVPSQSEVSDYGLLVTPDGLQVPLNPVWDGGDLVAFECKLFFPQSGETDIVIDTDLYWRVIGNTDIEAVALRASNDMYVFLGEGDAAIAGMEYATAAPLQWIDLGDGYVAIKTFNGAYLSLAGDNTIVASRAIDETTEFRVVDVGGEIALNASNGMLVTLDSNNQLVANGTELIDAELFSKLDLGYQSEWTTLVTYPEQFMLTGFTIEESYGSEIGLFYSSDEAQTIAANILMSYTYMRNATNQLTDQSSILADNDVVVDSLSQFFSHRDEAFKTMANDMMPNALGTLPAGEILPVIIANEDLTKTLEMSEVLPGMIAFDPSFVLDVSSFPIVSVRSLKTNFYNTSSFKAFSLEEVMSEILSWGLSETASSNILTMMMKWFNGEQLVAAVDDVEVSYGIPEDEIYNVVQNAAISSLEALGALSEGVWIFKAFKDMRVLKRGGFGFNSVVRSLKLKNTGLIGSWAKTSRNLGKINKGFVKAFKGLQKALVVFGILVDVGLSIYAGFLIADSIGGRLGGEIGGIYAFAGTLVAVVGAVILYAIGMIPYVGWLISLGLVIADLFGNYSSKLTEWLSEVIFGEQEDVRRVEVGDPGIEIIAGPTTNTIDPDGNGLDVGDTIEILIRFRGTVVEEVDDSIPFGSYIRPYIEFYVPQGEVGNSGLPSYADMEINYGNYWKSESYDSTAWAQPALPMVNYPTWVFLRYNYHLRYRWVHEVAGFWDCYHDDDRDGANVTSLATFYFDVMPATIDDFAMWGGISMLDNDGDELKNSEETVTNEWKYDSDGDGVRDKAEIDLGLDPMNFDTDGDGLDDEWELVYGTNATDSDTDDDLLPDYLEIAGWNIEFNYSQTEGGVLVPFTTRVYSNPRCNDSDGDGVDDYLEYQSGLNPRAIDTNGDSIPDEPAPETETVVENLWDMQVGSTMGFDIDSANNIHVGSFSQEILKFNPSGVQIPGYGLGDLRYPMSIAIDSQDSIYIQDWDIPDVDPQIWVPTDVNSVDPVIAMTRDGNTLAVGSRYDCKVWIYTRGASDWTLQQTIPTPFSSDHFGCSLSFTADGNALAIGARLENLGSGDNIRYSAGAVFIYIRSGSVWNWVQFIPAPLASSLSFGASIAFSGAGNVLVVSEGYHPIFHVYAGNPNSYSRFGSFVIPTQNPYMDVTSVASSAYGYRLVVGATDDDEIGEARAWVYEYYVDYATFLPYELVIPDHIPGDDYGFYVSMNDLGDTAIVGAPHYSDLSRGPGAAYVFEKDDTNNYWPLSEVEMTRLSDPSGQTNYRFGESLQLNPAGDLALIGSPGRGRGGMFFYQRIGTGWIPLSWVEPILEDDHTCFGISVAMDQMGHRLMGTGIQNSIFEPAPVFEFSTAPDRIVHFDSDGIMDDVFLPQLAWGYSRYLYAVFGMTTDSDENLYISYADDVISGIRKYTPQGDLVDFIGNEWLAHPCGVSIDSSGNIFVADKGNDDILKFSPAGELMPLPLSGFLEPEGVDVDSEGNIYVADTGNNRVLIFDENGIKIANFSFEEPRYIRVDSDGFVYVASYNTLAKFRVYEQVVEAEPPAFVLDWDEDGLSDDFETAGWDMAFENSYGVWTIHVDSDPAVIDTDLDGISDFDEWMLGSNPRSIDTDGDSLDDLFELDNGYNIANYDSDGELLDDGTELTFGSNPLLPDTDFDGTNDYWEWVYGTNPRNEDSDGDGATDTEEIAAGTDPLSPDSDGDFSFDGTELSLGTNPHQGDSDGDFLGDGLEHFYGTNPLSNDTDGDNVTDFVEIALRLNPLSNDTDGDNVTDGVELIWGTDPLDNDTDNDGVPDGLDPDTPTAPKGEIILVCDNLDDPALSAFADTLARYHSATIADLEDFLANYTNEPWIILVGDPLSPPDTVGHLIYTLMEDSPDVLATMTEEGGNHIAVRYGVWNETQTVVMLAQATSSDVYPVLRALKEKNVTMEENAVIVEFPLLTTTAHIVNIFLKLDGIDIVKATDSKVMISLSEPAQPTIIMSLYNQTTTPFVLTNETGLADYTEAMGKYLEIDMSAAGFEDNPIESAMIRIYYKASELDRTGNGLLNDTEDLNETTLVMYYYDEMAGEWIPLHSGLDWVIATGVNATDLYLFGETYAGFVWAQVTHLSLYSIAGMTHNRPPDVSGAYPSIEFLWPPNGKFHEITIEGIIDPDGDAVNITILGVTSDESVGWCPDAYGIGTNSTWLRAERDGCGNGRVYEITFLASDGRGGETIGSVFVYVPHHKKCGEYVIPVDDGQIYDATEPWRPRWWRWKWNWHWQQIYWHGFQLYLKHFHH